MKIVLLILTAVLFIGQIYSQGKETRKQKFAQDTTYIKSYTDKLILKLLLDTQFDSYSLNQNDTVYNLYPNIKSKISVGVVYRFIIANISFPQRWYFKNNNEEKLGKTNNFVFSLGLFVRKWYQYFYYSNTTGYYIENSQSINPSLKEGDLYYTLPNLSHRKFESTTYYIINARKFSYRSFLHQNELQKKSAGSLIPVLNFSYLQRKNYQETEKGVLEYTANVYSVSTLLGYQYNWVPIKNFNISAGMYIGGGMRMSDYNFNEGGKTSEKTPIANLTTNLGINYYYKKIFCGLKQTMAVNSSKQEANASIQNTSNYTVIFIGYRFDAPKILDKGYYKIFNTSKQ